MLERYGIYSLKDKRKTLVVLLSYPGVELNGTVVVAPLLQKSEIAVVQPLHPIVNTDEGDRVIAMERMASISPDLIDELSGSLLDYDYDISRAHSRLFFGN